MRLENLYPNFGLALPEDQRAFVAKYRLLRAEDMAKPSTYRKKSAAKKSKIDLSAEEKKLIKTLGLRQKDVLALRTSLPEEI